MIIRTSIFILASLLALATFVACPVDALSIGSIQKNIQTAFGKGGSADFTILFWNTEKAPCLVTLSAKSDENFVVTIFPREFVLSESAVGPPYGDGEYVQLPIGNVKSSPVTVTVKALGTAAEGVYSVPVTMKAESVESGIKFSQEKTFNFKINITGTQTSNSNVVTSPESNPIGGITLPDISGLVSLPEMPKITIPKIEVPKIDMNFIIIAVSIALIAMISFVVYRVA
jgi:hypothetical protein